MKKPSKFLILTLLSFCIVLPAFAWRSTTYYIKDSLKYCVREDSSYVMVSVMAVADRPSPSCYRGQHIGDSCLSNY